MSRRETPRNEGFSQKLLALFEASGIQGRLARAQYIGVHPSSYDNYVKAGRVPEWDILVRIARKFEVSTDYLLGVTTATDAEGNDTDFNLPNQSEAQNVFKKMGIPQEEPPPSDAELAALGVVLRTMREAGEQRAGNNRPKRNNATG